MFTQKIELMGIEYILMLGAWWAVMVIGTVIAMAIRRSVDRWLEHRHDARFAIVRKLDS